MSSNQAGRSPWKLLSRFGTLFVLLLLCVFFSFATLNDQYPTDEGAARDLASRIVREYPGKPGVLIVARPGEMDLRYAAALEKELERSGANILGKITGIPSAVRRKIEELGATGKKLDVVATHHFSAQGVLAGTKFKDLISGHPSLRSAKVLTPPSVRWPVFLKMSNLMDILNMISVIAIIAIGMTMVIITTGIDLSVGSLIALSGVIVACSARELGISPESGILLLFGCVLLGIAGCGLLGSFSGVMVTAFGIHPFIVTLSIMSIARGMSFIIADGPSDIVIEAESYRFLGAGRSLMGIPNSVILMMLLYVLAHLLMTRTVLGRHIYAVGGNREAAHLSGVPVKRVLIIVYTICGALAGLGGVVNSSLHGAGSAKSGEGYELQIIAAVVVGGTSLAGGSGNIMGTLVGALILGVIANGMNLTGVTTYPQMVVFGLLILVAVLIDQLKNRKTGAISGFGNALVIIGLVLMLMSALIFGGVWPVKGGRWLVSFAADHVFLAILFAVNGIFLITAGFLVRRKNRLSEKPLPTLKVICFGVLFIALFMGGLVGLEALDIADPWRIGYSIVGFGALCVLAYKEQRNRLGIESALNQLLFNVPFCSFVLTRYVLNEFYSFKSSGTYPWSLAVAFIAFVVVKITANKIKADRAGDRTLSETEEPGSGSSPAKESEEAGE